MKRLIFALLMSALMTTVSADEYQITTHPGTDRHPDWSPDGQYIAFNSYRSGNSDIWVIPITGEPAVRLTNSGDSEQLADWSYDQQSITFHNGNPTNGGIYTMRYDGSDQFRVIRGGNTPSWHPDGNMIAFMGYFTPGNSTDVWIINSDGQNLRRLVVAGSAVDGVPDCSPLGDKIAFASDRVEPAARYDIFVINIADSSEVQITDVQGYAYMPCWSPDGQMIAFEATWSGNMDIWAVSATGGTPTQITNNPSYDTSPSWSPDGTQIAFYSDRSGNQDIWVIDVDLLCLDGLQLPAGRQITDSGILFHERYTHDASVFGGSGPVAFDSTTVTLTKNPGDSFYISGSATSNTSWYCDDKLYVNNIPAQLGLTGVIDQDLPLCQDMDSVYIGQAATNITQLISDGSNTFRLVDTQRGLYGNSPIYIRRVPAPPPSLSTLRGTVTDNFNYGKIPNVQVSITGLSATTTTGQNGEYSLSDITPGTYSVVFDHLAEGYRDTTVVSVGLTGGQSTTLDVAMQSRVVLLVHGICSDSGAWDAWYDAFSSNDFIPVAVDLTPSLHYIAVLASDLNYEITAALQSYAVNSLQIVSHSMGGLASRQANFNNLGRIQRLIMLDTPNHGSRLALRTELAIQDGLVIPQVVAFLLNLGGLDCEFQFYPYAVRDLIPGSRFLNLLNHFSAQPSYDNDCQPLGIDMIRSRDNAEYWNIRGDCTSEPAHDYFGCNNDFVVTGPSMHLDFASNCLSSDWGCSNDHAHVVGGCTGVNIDSCVFTRVIGILRGTDTQSCEISPTPNLVQTETVSATLFAKTYTIAASSVRTDSVWIPTTDPVMSYSIGDDQTVDSFVLIDPLGTVVDSAYAAGDPSVSYLQDASGIYYSLQAPTSGWWQMQTTAATNNADRAAFMTQDGGPQLANNTVGQADESNNVTLLASFTDTQSNPIIGATITALLLSPDSTSQSVSLLDNGLSGDGAADDGQYGLVYTPTHGVGTYGLQLTAVTGNTTTLTTGSFLYRSLPDLSIALPDITLSNSSPIAGELVEVTATVHNLGTATIDNAVVEFSDNGLGAVFQTDTLSISPSGTVEITAYWIAQPEPIDHELAVQLTSLDQVQESSLTNNLVTLSVTTHIGVGTPEMEQGQYTRREFHVETGRPNPFASSTNIPFYLPERSRVTIAVFDVAGRKVTTLLDAIRDSGQYSVTWDGRDASRGPVSAGIYFYRVTVGNQTKTGKMTLLR